jgi:hypothetical protein
MSSLVTVVAVVLTTMARPSSASKIIVPSTTHATSRLDLNKVLPCRLPFRASDSSFQVSHDSHRGNLHLPQQMRRPLDLNYFPVHNSF